MRRLSPLFTALCLVPLTSSPGLAQWTQTQLSTPRSGVSATTVDGLVLVAGGTDTTQPSDVVDVFDETGTFLFQTNLTIPRWGIGAASSGHFAFFAGGGQIGQPAVYDTIDVFDAQSMTWLPTVHLTQPRAALAAAAVGDKVLFAGGMDVNLFPSDVVDVYDASVGPPTDPNAWSVEHLSLARSHLAAATVGDEVLFAGGANQSNGKFFARVDIYDDASGTWRQDKLSEARGLGWMASASLGTRAYFGGGQKGPGAAGLCDTVDIYDGSTQTFQPPVFLSVPRFSAAATAVGERVLFAGGASTFPTVHDTVDVWHAGAEEWEMPPQQLSRARFNADAVSIAGKAMFFGGQTGPGVVSDVVDIYDPLGGCSVTKYCGATQNPANAALIDIDTCYAASDGIHVSLSNGPPNQFGYLLVGDAGGTVAQPPGAIGDLCVAGGSCLGRYDKDAGPISAAGTFYTDIQNALSNPCNGAVSIAPGMTWHFQYWHRQPKGAPSTFSQALQVTFQ